MLVLTSLKRRQVIDLISSVEFVSNSQTVECTVQGHGLLRFNIDANLGVYSWQTFGGRSVRLLKGNKVSAI